MGRLILTAALLLSCLLAAPVNAGDSAAMPELSQKDHRRLDDGKIVIRIHRKGDETGLVAGSVTGITEIAGKPDDIWRAAMAFDVITQHNQVMQEVEVYRTFSPTAGHKVVDVRYHMRIFGKNIHYSIHHDFFTSQDLLRWNLDPSKDHDVNLIDGKITTRPGRNPGTTMMVFTSKIETGKPLPGFVEAHLTKTALKDYLSFLKLLAEGEDEG